MSRRRARLPRLSLLVAAGLAGLAAPPAARAQPAARIKVASIGASTTRGSGAPAGQSYPDQLGRLLGPGYEVRGFGKNGAGALKKGDPTYWNSAEFNAATAFAPDIVINWLGGADSKAASWEPHKAEFLEDYKGIIKHFQALPSHPRVISMLSIALYDDAGVRKTVLEGEVNPLQKRGAEECGVPWIDTKTLVDGHREYFADGVHLTTAGYAAIAKAAQAEVLKLAASADGGAGGAIGTDAGSATDAGGGGGAAGAAGGGGGAGGAAGMAGGGSSAGGNAGMTTTVPPGSSPAPPATTGGSAAPPAGASKPASSGGCAVGGNRAGDDGTLLVLMAAVGIIRVARRMRKASPSPRSASRS